jgi:hypothetical protein
MSTAAPPNSCRIFILSSSVITLQIFFASLSLLHLCFDSIMLSKANIIQTPSAFYTAMIFLCATAACLAAHLQSNYRVRLIFGHIYFREYK